MPGWDCHGLPIEHQVLKELGGQEARFGRTRDSQTVPEYAEKYVAIQREEFQRLGVLGDCNSHLTLNPLMRARLSAGSVTSWNGGGV